MATKYLTEDQCRLLHPQYGAENCCLCRERARVADLQSQLAACAAVRGGLWRAVCGARRELLHEQPVNEAALRILDEAMDVYGAERSAEREE